MPIETLPAPIVPCSASDVSVIGSPLPRRRALSVSLLRQPLGALLLLFSAVFAAYAPSLDGQFLWDDVFLVSRNLLIRSPLFCLEVFRHTLFDNESNFYRPTQSLTFIANYWAWGLDPFGYHLTSILIHATNAFLLFLVLRGVLSALLPPTAPAPGLHDEGTSHAHRTAWVALGLALVWAVHPVHSAAVAYVSGSADSLAMLCCLGAWLAAERALGATRFWVCWGWAALAFTGLVLGLCAKEIAGIWLALFLCYLFAVRKSLGSRQARVAIVAGGLLALGCYLALRHLPPPALTPPPPPKMPAKWLLMLRALGDYGSLMLYPRELFMERQVFSAPGLDNAPNEALYLSLAISGVGMLVAFIAGACWPGRGRALRRFGAGWFLLGFLPVSNLFALNASVAEHWLYLPSIGFLLFLTGVIVDLPFGRGAASSAGKLPGRRVATALTVTVGCAALALGARTWFRSFDWLDELSFYKQTVQDAGDVPRARAGLAMSLSRSHDEAGAITLLRDITTRYPHVLTPRINLANALLHQGQTAEAKTLLEQAAAALTGHDNNPREVVAAVDGLDKVEAADPSWPARRTALLTDTMRRHPDMWELVLISLREPDGAPPSPQALARVKAFAEAHWWHAPAHFKLGCMDAELNRLDDAVTAFRQAARLDVHDDAALAAAAKVCVYGNRWTQAESLQQEAVSRRPDSAQQRLIFARILQRCGDQGQADRQIAAANELMRLARK